MIEQRVTDAHGNTVIGFMADQPDNAVLRSLYIVPVSQLADCRQYHHDAVGNQSHAPDHALHSVVHLITAFLIHPAEIFNELLLLI